MYPRSKFQEILLAIREEMAREADFDVDLFVEMVRSGSGRGTPGRRYPVVDTEDDSVASERRGKRTGPLSK
jgi:hypothetical protein